MSSFRKYGGMNYAAKNNIVHNQYSNSDNLTVSTFLGQENSKIVSLSHIDMNYNSLMNTGEIYFSDGTSLSSGNTRGPQGQKGDTGAQGPQGVQGVQGPQGLKGDQGPQGLQGQQGLKGDQGIQGQLGLTGPQGQQGQQGPQGAQGPQGPQGPQGSVNVSNGNPTNILYLDTNKAITGSANLIYDDTSKTLTCGLFNATSDYRIKEAVEPLSKSLSVDELNPVTYINKLSNKRDIGFIAHEVQEVYPFLVSGEKDGENLQSLNYIGLIGILVKEIQDLKKRLSVLEST